jgi:hypothetical protein
MLLGGLSRASLNMDFSRLSEKVSGPGNKDIIVEARHQGIPFTKPLERPIGQADSTDTRFAPSRNKGNLRVYTWLTEYHHRNDSGQASAGKIIAGALPLPGLARPIGIAPLSPLCDYKGPFPPRPRPSLHSTLYFILSALSALPPNRLGRPAS